MFKRALKKTVDVLNSDIRDIIGKEGRLVDQEFLDELYIHLIKTDMGVAAATGIRDKIGADFRGRKVMLTDLVNSARGTIRHMMAQDNADICHATSGPTVIMVVGVNGSGKTTSIAKLANRFKQQGQSVVLGAGDTFRAAAVEQLTIWAQRIGAEIVTGKSGSDPASVAYKAVEAAKNQQREVCIIDTAGRLQTQSNLMDELSRIRRVIAKVIPEAPHEVLLVLDATAGQNALSQAKGFSQAAGCTGIVLAKLDGTAKGGVAIPIRKEFGLPVKFVGLGETLNDLQPFDVESYVSALFDTE
ncbi:MAG TPA: signal recognition particle-docking protein FtsY [Pirellulaceae bacterium]|nr:signal recognition particle-docking protein FtsY [Pirellulaceae bacterium]